jgi:predicted O-methyltransferase YrrM
MTWSSAVGPDGHVTALEFEPAYAKLAEEAWAANNIRNCHVIVGDAAQSMQKLAEELTESYDLIFIDADKSSYPKYLDLILSHSETGASKRLLKSGGIIIADNILRRGLVADSSDANPWSKNLDRNGGLWKPGKFLEASVPFWL